MSKPKVHLLIWEIPPNESDPEGTEYVLCGNESATEGSHSIGKVNCKRCIARRAAADAGKVKPNNGKEAK